MRTNSYVQQAELPLVPGMEVAGVREDTGERVIAMIPHGGYAEYVVAPAALTFPIPPELDDDTALAIQIQGMTAWHLYRTAGRVASGETVVVHSAAGGVGSLAVQLGKPMGAGRVIATASSQDKRELALELGADVALDPAPEGLAARLIDANGGRGVDVVFEMSGGQVFDESYRALAHFGRVVAYGIAGGEPNRVSTGSLLRHSRSVVGFYLMHVNERPDLLRESLADLFERAVRGELRVVVGGVYPLADAARAQEDLRSRRTTGKLMLDPTA